MRALKLLNTLFSPTVLPDEKKRILSEKYNIAMTVELESEVQRMCNLGTAIESKAHDEGLAEVTWINPCIVEENEGGGVFLLPFSDILQVFQKSITKQYILEMLSGNGLEVSATIQTIRLGYRRIETEDQIIPVWDFIGTYSSPQTEQLLADADDLWVQCYLRQERTDSLLTINANDGTIVDWGNEL